MKFLMISSFLPSVLNFRGKLLEAIHAQGYEIHIMAPEFASFPEEQQKLQALGYHLHEIPMQRTGTNPVADLKLLKNLYQQIRQIQPEYVLSYTIKPVIYGTLAAWLAKVPHRFALITGLGYAFQNVESGKRSLFQKLVHGLYAQALKRSDKVFFQNPDDLKLFQDMHLLDANKPTVVVNGSGVNVQDFDVMPLPKDDAGVVKASFLLIARLLGDKGVREYAESARIIKAQYPEAEFHLVGWIDDNPSAISQAELDTWIADGRLKYWGKLSDVRPAIAESSVYVLPSYREGVPRSTQEAMAIGRAVITTDVPGCRETVVDGLNGFLVPKWDPEALAKKMIYFIEHPEQARLMGAESYKIAVEKFDAEKVNQRLVNILGL